jgi:hypothetical protein
VRKKRGTKETKPKKRETLKRENLKIQNQIQKPEKLHRRKLNEKMSKWIG